ncbi:hypothetical protein DFJ74DRAFT_656061 [Hyaloraphidium curvatum]|nr:hypothetical protein DFJ74DRAFT_656061 [Hyaloraphidium curvatum]
MKVLPAALLLLAAVAVLALSSAAPAAAQATPNSNNAVSWVKGPVCVPGTNQGYCCWCVPRPPCPSRPRRFLCAMPVQRKASQDGHQHEVHDQDRHQDHQADQNRHEDRDDHLPEPPPPGPQCGAGDC